MTAASIEVRPLRRRDADLAADFLASVPPAPGCGATVAMVYSDPGDHVAAFDGGLMVGLALVIPGRGRCATVLVPRLRQWDDLLAGRLCRAAAAGAVRRHGARLIQMLLEPQGADRMEAVLARAGFEPLAVLSYLRRPVTAADRQSPPPSGSPPLRWRFYSTFSHGQFARTIAGTYQDSLDCPKLAGLRTVGDAIATHKSMGVFTPRAWRLAVIDGRPAGVALVNNVQARGELVYMGVLPEFRRRGVARAMLVEAIRDTAAMGLPQIGTAVDLANTPAVRLYESAGFKEVRRKATWFVPASQLEVLQAEARF